MDGATSTDGGLLLAAAVLLPFVAMLLGMAVGGRQVQRVALAVEHERGDLAILETLAGVEEGLVASDM